MTNFLANSQHSRRRLFGNTLATHTLTRLVEHALIKAICNNPINTLLHSFRVCLYNSPNACVLHSNWDEHFKGWIVLTKVGRSRFHETLQRRSCGTTEDSSHRLLQNVLLKSCKDPHRTPWQNCDALIKHMSKTLKRLIWILFTHEKIWKGAARRRQTLL